MTALADDRAVAQETLGWLIQRAARRYRRHVAVTDPHGASRTYGDLLDRGSRFANALHGLGLCPGDRVAAMLEDRAESVEIYIGAMLAGCVVVHVNSRHTASELDHVLADSEAAALVFGPSAEAAVGDSTGVETLRTVISTGAISPVSSQNFDELVGGASAVAPKESRSADDPAILAYTSGTTGRPKGAMVSHRSVVACARVAPYYYRLPPGGRLAFASSFSFVGTVWAQVFPPLYIGGSVDILGKLSGEQWVERIAATGAAFTYVASPRIGEFIEALRHDRRALESLITVMHSGSAAPRAQLVELFDVVGMRLTEHWGSTEVVGSLTATMPDDYGAQSAADDVFTSVGRPLPTADVRVVDDHGDDVPAGVEGELWVRSDSMFSGYWRAPDTDAATFSDGWLKLSDIGYRDEAGYVYLVGRSSDLIVSGGANVYPAEVERVIQELPAVQHVGVFGLPHERWGETVVAAIVVAPGDSLDEEAVLAHCRQHLAGYKKPTRVEFIVELPVNASFKLDRRALRASFADVE